MSDEVDKLRLKQQAMTNEELVKRASDQVSSLCKTGGRSLTMCVPPKVTDTDMILSELIRRYEILYSPRNKTIK